MNNKELQERLREYPDDYEVIFKWGHDSGIGIEKLTKYDGDKTISIQGERTEKTWSDS